MGKAASASSRQAKSRARGHIHSPVLVLVQSPSMGTLTLFPASPQSKHRPGASRVQNPELPFDNLDSGRVQAGVGLVSDRRLARCEKNSEIFAVAHFCSHVKAETQ